jgi:hypothetical protein
VKVFQVNEEYDFLVLSMQGGTWAREGATVILEGGDDKPVVTVQLTELDGAGFAVAQIMRRMGPGVPIRKGDLLFARLLPNP